MNNQLLAQNGSTTELKQRLLQMATTVLPPSIPLLDLTCSEMALLSKSWLENRAICPDNPACSKRANYQGDMCHNSPRLAFTVYSNWLSLDGFLSVSMFFHIPGGHPKTTAQDSAPSSRKICNWLAYWQQKSWFTAECQEVDLEGCQWRSNLAIAIDRFRLPLFYVCVCVRVFAFSPL